MTLGPYQCLTPGRPIGPEEDIPGDPKFVSESLTPALWPFNQGDHQGDDLTLPIAYDPKIVGSPRLLGDRLFL